MIDLREQPKDMPDDEWLSLSCCSACGCNGDSLGIGRNGIVVTAQAETVWDYHFQAAHRRSERPRRVLPEKAPHGGNRPGNLPPLFYGSTATTYAMPYTSTPGIGAFRVGASHFYAAATSAIVAGTGGLFGPSGISMNWSQQKVTPGQDTKMEELPLSIEPIESWRVWRVDELGRLNSYAHPIRWPMRARMEAACVRGVHQAPHVECTCGLYSANTLENLLDYIEAGLDTVMIGQVKSWGRIVKGETGLRAQYAYPSSLYFVGGDNIETLDRMLLVEHRYGVSVGRIKNRNDLTRMAIDEALAAIQVDDAIAKILTPQEGTP
jgi:hypothetical protein